MRSSSKRGPQIHSPSLSPAELPHFLAVIFLAKLLKKKSPSGSEKVRGHRDSKLMSLWL